MPEAIKEPHRTRALSSLRTPVLPAGCCSHSRRKFYKLHVAESSKVATATGERIAKLWQIEETIRGKNLDGRVAARQQSLRWLPPT